MRTALALLITCLFAPFAQAKCTIPMVTISGKVTDGSGAGVADANVAVSWTRRGMPQGPAQARSDADGTFVATFQFNTFTKHAFLRGDVCREALTHISVSASTPGSHSEYTLVPVTDWSGVAHLEIMPSGNQGAAP